MIFTIHDLATWVAYTEILPPKAGYVVVDWQIMPARDFMADRVVVRWAPVLIP